MSFVKITPELLAAVGAKTEDEFSAKLVEKLLGIGAQAPDAALTLRVTACEGKVGTIESSVAALPKPMDKAAIEAIAVAAIPADIKALAKTEGSRAAVTALANTGSSQPAAANPQNADEGGNGTPVLALIEAGKFDEAYAADKKAQAEFGDAKVYAAYMKNRHNVRLATKVRAES